VTQSFSYVLKLLRDQATKQAQAQKEQFALMTQLLQKVMAPSDFQSQSTGPAPPLQYKDTPDLATPRLPSPVVPTLTLPDPPRQPAEPDIPINNEDGPDSASSIMTTPAVFTVSKAATEGIQINASPGTANQPTQELISSGSLCGTAGQG
jgi:hypothetical protein